MRIAIFHNLQKGGGLNSIIEPLKTNSIHQIDLYSFNNFVPKELVDNYYTYHLNPTSNILKHLITVLIKLPRTHRKIAKDIDTNNYDLILVYPCLWTQSPYILRYVNRRKSIYILHEPKREFYEPTSYDHYSLKRTLARIIRLPIKYIDVINCKHAGTIICNSKYSQKRILNIYNRKSHVVYPGMVKIPPKRIIIKNNKRLLSVGLLSRIKGHDFSIKQVKKISPYLTILGRSSEDQKYIENLAKREKVTIKHIVTEDDSQKYQIYKKHSIFLSNGCNEPFGITTLEATVNNCFVLGKNEGGIPEIIQNGKNGFLYSSLEEGRKILVEVLKKDKLEIIQSVIIDWSKYFSQIFSIYNYTNNDKP